MQNCIKVRRMELGGMNDKQLIKSITPKLLVIVEICVSFKKEKTTTNVLNVNNTGLSTNNI